MNAAATDQLASGRAQLCDHSDITFELFQDTELLAWRLSRDAGRVNPVAGVVRLVAMYVDQDSLRSPSSADLIKRTKTQLAKNA